MKLHRHRRWLQEHGRAVGLKSGATVPQRDVMLSAHRAEFPFPKRHRQTTGVLGEAYNEGEHYGSDIGPAVKSTATDTGPEKQPWPRI